MANIKFFRKNAAPSNPVDGYIWFNTVDRTINLYKDGNWEKYSGIVSAAFNENVLTITPAVGDPIAVDLSDLVALRNELNEEKGKIGKLQTALATVIGQLKNIEEKEGAVKEYVDGKVDGKFDAIGSAEQALTDAKQYTDDEIGKLSFDEAGTAKTLADQALADAKSYADGKFQVAGNYETAGAAAQALTDAKAYVDDVVGVLPTTGEGEDERTMTVAETIEAMDARVDVLEAIDHNKLAQDAADAAVARVVADAPESFDTLKDIADWIADNSHAEDVAGLLTDVENLKKIDHDAYKGADDALRTELQGYADQAEADALSAAKSYTDNVVSTINTTIEENELVVAEALNDLNTRVDNLASGTVTSVTGGEYISTQTTDGAVIVDAITGSVANGADALAVASDVKSYVDSKVQEYVDDSLVWGEF